MGKGKITNLKVTRMYVQTDISKYRVASLLKSRWGWSSTHN